MNIMDQKNFYKSLINAWVRHNGILVFLLKSIPEKALVYKPSGSRGRDIARQFVHMARVREGWSKYFITGKRPKIQRYDKGNPPSKKEITEMLKQSGDEVKDVLGKILKGDLKIRYFKQDLFRWYSYLIEHEAHHRGQILLTLKQNDFKLSDDIKLKGIWGKWIFGK